MRAAVCHAFGEPFEIEEVSLAAPGPEEVRVRVMACAICHSDVIFADGGWGGETPLVLGHEASGVVEAVGGEVSDLKPGDRVVITLIRHCGDCPCCTSGFYGSCETLYPLDAASPLSFPRGGGVIGQGLRTAAFAEETVVHRSQLVKLGDDIPFQAAALLACGVITGLGAVVNSAKVRDGQDVVVIGTGGVGLNAVQGAGICNAGRVIAVDLADEKLDAAMEFGATHRVNATERDAIDTVRAITKDRGADYVFVTVGSEEAINQSFRMIGPGGAAILVGIPAIGAKAGFNPVKLTSFSQRIIGSKMGDSLISRDIPWLVELYREGRLKLDELITHRYSFDDINEAMDAARQGVGLRNMVLIGDSP
jgi:Zn-dependent alcohol dehydrogenase